jgi:hypothetical protein
MTSNTYLAKCLYRNSVSANDSRKVVCLAVFQLRFSIAARKIVSISCYDCKRAGRKYKHKNASVLCLYFSLNLAMHGKV